MPTIVSYSSLLLRSMEQNVDIPVPGHGAGLQGLFPGQSSTTLVAQTVDNPSPGGGLQGFRPGQSLSAPSSSPAGVHENADDLAEGIFRTFPRAKKSEVRRQSEYEGARQVEHMDSG